MIDETHLWHKEDASATTVQWYKRLMALPGKIMKSSGFAQKTCEFYFGPFLALILLSLFLTGTSYANSCPDFSAGVNAIVSYCNELSSFGYTTSIDYYIDDPQIDGGLLVIECICYVAGIQPPRQCDFTVAADPGCFQSRFEEGNTGTDASLVGGSSGAAPSPLAPPQCGGGDIGASGGLFDVSSNSSVNIDSLALRE